MNTLYTIGHSNQSFEEFLEMLQTIGVQAVADVRSVPASKYTPQFNREPLQAALKRNGIAYLPFGEEFGARRTDSLDADGKVNFEMAVETPAFLHGTERVKKGLEKGYKIALMCSEANPLECHRFAMVSRWFYEHGVDVEHIVHDAEHNTVLRSHKELQDEMVAGIIDMRLAQKNEQQEASAHQSEAYRLAEEFSQKTNKCLFITGKAGTGKTTFLRRLREVSPKNIAVVAPTGVAAINAGGMTIHSFFQLPIRTLVPTQQSYRQMFAEQRMMQRKRQMLYHLEMLVIDEISMVRADVLDAIDAVLRHYRYRRDLPFGGVQVVMIGDLMQLQPVVHGDEERETMAKYYEGPYFFQSKVMQEVQPVYIEFDHVFRQQNEDFVRLLNEVRENRLSGESRAMLAARYMPNFASKDSFTQLRTPALPDDFHITLTTHNQQADDLNHRRLDELTGRTYHFEAVVHGDFPENSYPTEQSLTLKEGARVMFIRNDDQKPRRFYNGKLGIVAKIGDDAILVSCEDGDIEVEPMTWENIRYKEDPKSGKIEEELLGTFTQYPLRLAWAITIHKSQGLTFDRVIVDAARAFAAGQVYVALSRCRTLEGIILSSPLQNVSLGNDRQVLNYVHNQLTTEQSAASLGQAQKEYQLHLFSGLYDIKRLQTVIEQLQKHVAKCVSFNPQTVLFLDNLERQVSDLVAVSEKFQRQLAKIIISEGSHDYLQQRLTAAAGYFVPRIQELADKVSEHPCRCKNKADAADFDTIISDLYLVLSQKTTLMQAVSREASTEAYLQAKSKFVAAPMQTPSAFDKPETTASKKTKSESQKKQKPKKEPKPSTYELTYQLYSAGKTPEQIAEIRKLNVGTILGHLAKYVEQGQILITDFVPTEIINKILSARADNPKFTTLKEFYELFDHEIPYAYLRAVLEKYNLL